MKNLSERTCRPCDEGAEPLSTEKAQEYLKDLNGWDLIEEDGEQRIVRAYDFGDFRASLDFTNTVGELAESVGHHPKITTEWGRTRVEWWTHKIGGLDEADFIMAARTDRAYDA